MKKFKIGDSFEGGIIFHINMKNAEHGLIATTEDQSKGCSWEEALQICIDCREGGYDDWYLPSQDELNLLYQLQNVIGGFAEDYYWSSTEEEYYSAWNQFFEDGYKIFEDKVDAYRVRAIRAF